MHELACRKMGTIPLPISLVTNSRCTQILSVTSDSMATIGQLTSQLEELLIGGDKLMRTLTYKGARLSLDSKLHIFAPPASARAPRFVVS